MNEFAFQLNASVSGPVLSTEEEDQPLAVKMAVGELPTPPPQKKILPSRGGVQRRGLLDS